MEYARAIIRAAEYESKTEEQYAERVELLRHAGEIRDWRYAPATWRLGPYGARNSFRPDFMIVCADGTIEWHEVKGTRRLASGGTGPFWRGDARAKAYTAPELYPWFRWKVTWKDRGGWNLEEI